MHKNIHYSGEHADIHALSDLKKWIGTKRYNTLTKEFRKHPAMEMEKFELLVSFSGVSGFPVRAWHKHIWSEK